MPKPTTEERPFTDERQWLAGVGAYRPHARHAVGLLTVAHVRYADRWQHATCLDLLGELREQVAEISARAALTVAAAQGKQIGGDVRVDETLREIVAALDGAYRSLSILCGRIGRHGHGAPTP